nr:phage terminase large subunit [Deinococcus arboris]
MQRLHEEDLTGHLERKGGWVILRLPEKYEPEYHTVTPIWEDPRKEPGELLFPEFRDEADYQQAELDLGTFGTAGQLQQRPVPEGGGVVKGWWWRYHAPAELLPSLPPLYLKVVAEDGSVTEVEAVVVPTPEAFDFELTSWDFAFKEKKDSDFVVGQAWGSRGADTFLRGQVRGRWDYVKSKAALVGFSEAWPGIPEHLVEDKANGTAIMTDLRSTLTGLIGYDPPGSKQSRVATESSTIEGGNVYLPHPNLAPWVASEYLKEWAQFPNGANDDQVDATTQALQRLKQKRKAWTQQQGKSQAQPTALPGLTGLGGQKTSAWRR